MGFAPFLLRVRRTSGICATVLPHIFLLLSHTPVDGVLGNSIRMSLRGWSLRTEVGCAGD